MIDVISLQTPEPGDRSYVHSSATAVFSLGHEADNTAGHG